MTKTIFIILLFGLVACGYGEEVTKQDSLKYRVAVGLNVGSSAVGPSARFTINEYFGVEGYLGKMFTLETEAADYSSATLRGLVSPNFYSKHAVLYAFAGVMWIEREKEWGGYGSEKWTEIDNFYTPLGGFGVEFRLSPIALNLSLGMIGKVNDSSVNRAHVDAKLYIIL